MMLRLFCLPLALAAACLVPAAASAAPPADTAFDGPYIGLELGRQNTIAGALVGGVDTLKQSVRSVAALNAGYRLRLTNGLVAGLEVGYGLTDGDLSQQDPVNGLSIDYRNSTQIGYGGTFGYAWGETLLFAYLSEVKRSFDVTIHGPLGVGRQTDKQGLLRYGLGIERRLTDIVSVRATTGRSRADFGGRRTNIDPKHKIDVGLGVVAQF